MNIFLGRQPAMFYLAYMYTRNYCLLLLHHYFNMKKFLTALSALAVLLVANVSAQTLQPINRIAFGSCNNEDLEQPHWEHIMSQNPDLWIWMGDNIYADTEDTLVLKGCWDKQMSNPGYAKLVKTVPVIGTWDDHDYGQNNVGKDNPIKKASQCMFLDFVGEPKDSPRRKQEGVYTSYTYGPEGKKVKVVLLDTRYNRDDYSRKGDLLGDEQWKWLENELNTSTAQINIIGTSIQFIPNRALYELWRRFPESKKRLDTLIVSSKASGVLFISGDVHHSEFLKDEIKGREYPIYEFTSSGLTHYNKIYHAFNKRRTIGKVFFGKAYGIIDFDWGPQPAVSFKIIDEFNNVVREHKMLMTDLGVKF